MDLQEIGDRLSTAGDPAVIQFPHDKMLGSVPFRADGSGRLDEQQQMELIDYLREENRVLREQLGKGDYASTMTSAADWP